MASILPVFLSFAACGNRCIFCDQNIISGVYESGDIIKSAYEQIKKWREKKDSWSELAFYGGNFGAIERNTRLALYKIARNAGIDKIRFSTRPDTVTDELLAEIKDEAIELVELGIQSLSDEVLKLNGRPYDERTALKSVEKICGVTSCGVQLMTGMFGQNYVSSVNDAESLAVFPLKTARIYPTVVIRGTILEQFMKDGSYSPTALKDIIAAAGGMFVRFESADIKVIRMGLPFDGDIKDNAAGGAIHESFGDLVKTFLACLYCILGRKISFAGYKGFVRKNYSHLFDSSIETDFGEICRELRSSDFADNRRYFEGQAYNLACKLESSAYHR